MHMFLHHLCSRWICAGSRREKKGDHKEREVGRKGGRERERRERVGCHKLRVCSKVLANIKRVMWLQSDAMSVKAQSIRKKDRADLHREYDMCRIIVWSVKS